MLKESTKNFFIGLARTATPILAGIIITFLTNIGLNLPDEVKEEASFIIFGLLSFAYYAAAAAAERYISPKFGWLLGYAKAPEYQKTLSDNQAVIKAATTPEEGDKGLAG